MPTDRAMAIFRQGLAAAMHPECTPRQRARIADETAARAGVGRQTVYRWWRELGWRSGRKERSDKGRSKVSDEAVVEVAKLVAGSKNKRGRPNMPMSQAVRLSKRVGRIDSNISERHMARRMAELGVSSRHLQASAPATQRVSLHPNHVWQIDVSVALQWHFYDESGQRLGQRDATLLYEGKREKLARLNNVVLRYVCVDHTTGLRYCRYYYSAGESAEDAVDFLWHCIAPKDHPTFHFQGIPKRLVTDQGPAFKAGIFQNLVSYLGIELEQHAPGNARASGAVEKRHLDWQSDFEGVLHHDEVNDLVRLNELALNHAADRGFRDIHERTKRSPLRHWCSDVQPYLRAAPTREQFDAMVLSRPVERTVDAHRRIRLDNELWFLEGDVLIGSKVLVQRAPRLGPDGEGALVVTTQTGQPIAATRQILDEKTGFPISGGRFHVWDDPEHAGAGFPLTPAQQVLQAATEPDPGFAAAVWESDAKFRDAELLLPVPQPQAWSPSSLSHLPPAQLISDLDARAEVVAAMGRSLTVEEADWWRARVGDGLTRDELEAAMAEFVANPAVAVAGGQP